MVIVIAVYMIRNASAMAIYCQTPILTWMKVQTIFYCLSLAKNLISILIVYNSTQLKRHLRLFDLTYAILITSSEFGWLVYGNTFHYSEEGYACKVLSSETKQLWIFMQIILAVGYALLIKHSFMCIALWCLCFCAPKGEIKEFLY